MHESPDRSPHDRPTADPAASPMRDRNVDAASRESFPASDAPAWTPLAATGAAPRADRAPGEPDAAAPAALQAMLTALESRDPDRCLALLADDATVRIGHAPPLVGRAAVRDWLAAHVAPLVQLRHSVLDVRGDADGAIAEADFTLRRADGASATVPVAVSAHRRGDRLVRLQWYGDPRVWA